MKPAEFLKKTEEMARRLSDMKRKSVVVGLPTEKVSSKIYGDGMAVIGIGATHEYGTETAPQRSFLRAPFAIKRKELNAAISAQFKAVSEGGVPVPVGLGLIGVVATNISKGAFATQGYGTWAPIQPETIRRKGSSKPLLDTGILRSSISWVIRDDTA